MTRQSFFKAAIFVFAFISLFLLSEKWSHAEDIYYAQVQSGDSTGNNCTNAKAISTLTWGAGAGNIGAGDTAHLCGTFNGSAGGNLISVGASGASGNAITIKFETGAILSAPYWSTTQGAIFGNGQSYITIDGGTNGIVKNTANGTARTYQAESYGIHMGNGSNNTVKNLTISDIYVRTPFTSGSTGFDSEGIKFTGGNNILVTGNIIKNVKSGITYVFSLNFSNVEISKNTFSGSDVGVIVASGPNTTLTTVNIHHNDFAGEAQLWDSPGNEMHHNAIHMWAQATNSRITGVNIYNNYVHGTMGNDQTYYNSTNGTHITSLFYLEETGGTVIIYNNIFDLSTGGALNSTSNGMVFCKESIGQTCQVYNNTFKSSGRDTAFETAAGAGGHAFKNNITYNVGYPIYLPNGNGVVTSDYNLYYGASNWGANFLNWTQWKVAGQDAHGFNGIDPNLNTSYVPQVGSVAIGNGTSLSQIFTTDYAGTTLTLGVAWDIGPYQSNLGQTTPPNLFPKPPVGIIIK